MKTRDVGRDKSAGPNSDWVADPVETPEELHLLAEELSIQNQELVATRQALEEEHRRYRDLFDFAPDGYVVTDPYGVILEVNLAAAALLGVDRELLVHKPLSIFVDEPDLSLLYRHLDRLARGQASPDSWEVRIRPQRGAAFHAAVKVSVALGGDGGPARLR